METRLIRLAVSVMIFVFSPAHAFTLFVEAGIDRPGCDFKNFVVPGNTDSAFFDSAFNVCMNACGLDQNCAAWSFDGRSGTCFLKNNFCGPVRSGSSGGIKLPATVSSLEANIDRPGCDFSSFPATNPTTHLVDLQICMLTCAENSSCQAWNFDPRVGTGTCFLKNCVAPPIFSKVPPPTTAVTSGVKYSQ